MSYVEQRKYKQRKKTKQLSREELAAEHDEVTMTGWWGPGYRNVTRKTQRIFHIYMSYMFVKINICDFCCDRFFRRMKDM